MPAWITSLLREEGTVPMPSAASSTITLPPAWASCRATASTITPAPITTQSTLSMYASGPGIWHATALSYYGFVQKGRRANRWILSKYASNVAFVSEALIMSGQLPQFEPHFPVARVGVYPIQTREARHSALEIRG